MFLLCQAPPFLFLWQTFAVSYFVVVPVGPSQSPASLAPHLGYRSQKEDPENSLFRTEFPVFSVFSSSLSESPDFVLHVMPRVFYLYLAWETGQNVSILSSQKQKSAALLMCLEAGLMAKWFTHGHLNIHIKAWGFRHEERTKEEKGHQWLAR